MRRRTKRRREGCTERHVYQLLEGHDFFDSAFGDGERCDVDAMRTAWEQLRDGLLAGWIAETPGTRPYAWWEFDAPEQRRRVGTAHWLYPVKTIDHTTPEPHYEVVDDGKPHPFDDPERIAKVEEWRREYPEIADRKAYKLSYGTPNSIMGEADADAVFETETEYLDRLGLLTQSEWAAVRYATDSA